MATTCKIRVTFTTEVQAEDTLLFGWRSYVGPLNQVGNVFETKTGNEVVMACDSSRPELQANGFVIFDLQRIRNPFLVKTTSSLKVELLTNSKAVIAYADTGLIYNQADLLPGSITEITVTPLDSEVQRKATKYGFMFKPNHRLFNAVGNSPVLKVSFPSGIVTKAGCTLTDLTAVDAGVSCT